MTKPDALESERFRRAGSDKLWTSLLGWDDLRRGRAWLAQAVHDGARGGAPSPEAATAALEQFARRRAEAAARLDADSIAIAIDLWRSAPNDGAATTEPPPKWEYLVNLARRAGLGDATAEDQRGDWLVWIRLEAASAPRVRLMKALEEAERAAIELAQVTESDPAESVAKMTRLLWSALAYGDDDAFGRINAWAKEWLARGKVPEGVDE